MSLFKTDKKMTLSELEIKFPGAVREFTKWWMDKFHLSDKHFDQGIMQHKYLVWCRFLGEPSNELTYFTDIAIQRRLVEIIGNYEKALQSEQRYSDPLDKLTDMPWEQRNELTKKTWIRKSKPGICDTLVPLTNFIRPSLFDSLIPFTGRNAEIRQENDTYEYSDEQMWKDNIQWAWDVQAGKIKIPF